MALICAGAVLYLLGFACAIEEPTSFAGTTDLTIDTSSVIAVTRDEYVSWNLDSTDNRDFFERNITNPQLARLAKEISPAYMRVGGTGAKFLFYQVGADSQKKHPGKITWNWNKYHWSWDAAYLSQELWDSVNNLAVASGAKLIWNMDEAVFAEDGGENLRSLLQYSIQKGYAIHVIEVSNEQGTPPVEIYAALAKLLEELYPSADTRPGIVAPDGGPRAMTAARENAIKANVPLLATTYHDYNDAHSFDDCGGVLKPYVAPNNSLFYSKVSETWIGEAATCGQGGKKGVSDSFASGLWYWQYLGRLAQLNHKVFLRQTLVGGNYGLLRDRFWDKTMQGDTLKPNADYFSAVLFTRVMGNEVFHTKTPDDSVQAYAHCARTGQHGFKAGALAVAVINLDTKQRTVRLGNGGLNSNSRHTDYIMTADGSTPYAQYVKLNGGKRLEDAADLVGIEAVGNVISLPAQSYGAVLFPDAAVDHCSTTPTPPSPSPPPTPPSPPVPPAPPSPPCAPSCWEWAPSPPPAASDPPSAAGWLTVACPRRMLSAVSAYHPLPSSRSEFAPFGAVNFPAAS